MQAARFRTVFAFYISKTPLFMTPRGRRGERGHKNEE
nr:MAG TPA: hypothetical protein [Caudoviricetes sp.]